MFTSATKITEAQYEAAFIFINEETGDHYLIYQDENGIDHDLWIGRDNDSLKTTIQENVGQKIKGQFYTDETGSISAADGYIFSTSESYNDLDLDALAEGRIEWM